jgi:hypothetical protein
MGMLGVFLTIVIVAGKLWARNSDTESEEALEAIREAMREINLVDLIYTAKDSIVELIRLELSK